MSVAAVNTLPKSGRSIFQWMGEHWFETFIVVYGAWVFTPFLAPVFMHMGWIHAGKSIYFIYSLFCHQLPERSFFLFGQKTMYSLTDVQAAWQNSIDPFILRQFIGNETMGWKIAWSDRMISFYSSVWFFAILWYPVRRRVQPLPWWILLFFLSPMILDGITHAISDFAGIGQGFRDTNVWLAVLTNNSFAASFYIGDALGSFNSLMRFASGILAGVGIVWLAFPYIFQSQAYNQQLDEKSYAKVIEQIKYQHPRASGGRS